MCLWKSCLSLRGSKPMNKFFKCKRYCLSLISSVLSLHVCGLFTHFCHLMINKANFGKKVRQIIPITFFIMCHYVKEIYIDSVRALKYYCLAYVVSIWLDVNVFCLICPSVSVLPQLLKNFLWKSLYNLILTDVTVSSFLISSSMNNCDDQT